MLKSRYKTVCKVLKWVILIGGIIGSIILADILGMQVKISSSFYSTYRVRNSGLTAMIFISGVISSIITSTIFGALGEVLAFIEKLSAQTAATANGKIEEKANILREDDSLPPL